jgi:hypothetical protein
MKGVYARVGLMCQTLPPPDPNADLTPPAFTATDTTREATEKKTEQPGSSCISCHKTLLNPLGFITENFDGLGRLRTQERLFDPDGGLIASKPVNTVTQPSIAGYTGQVSDSAQVVQLLIAGGDFQTCFARKYFTYTFYRREDDSKDGCLLAELQDMGMSGQPLKQVLMAIPLSVPFKTKVMP